MTIQCIAYRCGYKYQLEQDYLIKTNIIPPKPIVTPYIQLSIGGFLSISKGYAWDGPSGPTIDTKDFMRGSLVHDALYQLMREGYLDHDIYRKQADELLRTICIEDGMSKIAAECVYEGVRLGGGSSADPKHNRKIIYAPRHPNIDPNYVNYETI